MSLLLLVGRNSAFFIFGPVVLYLSPMQTSLEDDPAFLQHKLQQVLRPHSLLSMTPSGCQEAHVLFIYTEDQRVRTPWIPVGPPGKQTVGMVGSHPNPSHSC